MAKSLNRFAVFLMLQNSFKLTANILAGLILASVILNSSPVRASAGSPQITLSIDATLVPTFSDLISQAESIAANAISQQFQADPSIRELQITVLGERNGQIISLLSSKISRSTWRTGSNIREWTQYYATSSALLGYQNFSSVSTQDTVASRAASFEQSPSEMLEEARVSKRITEAEYWQLVDAID